MPSGRFINIPELIIPDEYLPVPLIIPDHFVKDLNGIAIANVVQPIGARKFNVPITVELGGDNIDQLDHWCILVYGIGGNKNSYKVVSGHETTRSISCTVNTHNLPTGKLTIGAAIYLKWQTDGFEVMSMSRLWLDNDPPEFHQIIAGPKSGETLSKANLATLEIRPALKDPGGAGTEKFTLALEGPEEIRHFDETNLGYQGLMHANLQGLKPGRYDLLTTLTIDKLGNAETALKKTGVWYQITE